MDPYKEKREAEESVGRDVMMGPVSERGCTVVSEGGGGELFAEAASRSWKLHGDRVFSEPPEGTTQLTPWF